MSAVGSATEERKKSVEPPAWVYLPFDIRTPEAHPQQDRDLLLGLNQNAVADDIALKLLKLLTLRFRWRDQHAPQYSNS